MQQQHTELAFERLPQQSSTIQEHVSHSNTGLTVLNVWPVQFITVESQNQPGGTNHTQSVDVNQQSKESRSVEIGLSKILCENDFTGL